MGIFPNRPGQVGPVRYRTGPVWYQTGRFGTKPAGSVSNRSSIRLTNRFDPVWFRTGEPAGSGSGLDDF